MSIFQYCNSDLQPLNLKSPILHLYNLKSRIMAAQQMETLWRAQQRAPKNTPLARHRTHSRSPTATCTFNLPLHRRSATTLGRADVKGRRKRRRNEEERKNLVPTNALPTHPKKRRHPYFSRTPADHPQTETQPPACARLRDATLVWPRRCAGKKTAPAFR
jgi:hypothetical protein